jgi:hypothetical protein
MYPLDGRLGEFQNQSGYCGEEIYILPLPVIEPDFSAIQPVIHHYTN